MQASDIITKEEYKLQTLFWETTLRCNARCEFCGSSCGETVSFPDELTTEEICSALTDIASKLDPTDVMLNVTGGEPLLRRDLFEVTAHADALGFQWGMVTNGSLITPAVIQQMKRTNMRTLTVSIDGCKNTHERLRRLHGCFDRIIAALKNIAKAGFCEHIQVTTVVNKKNLHELPALREILLDTGADTWRVIAADPIGRAKDNAEILLDKNDMREYLAFLEKYTDDPILPVMTSCSHFFGDMEHKLRTTRFECGAGKRVASILMNGDIFVCPNVERRPELVQGNVRTDSLADLWKSGFGFFRRKDRTLSEKCLACYYKDRCRGDSLHTFDFDTHTPRSCIRDYYTDGQSKKLERMSELYFSVIEKLRAENDIADNSIAGRMNKDCAGSYNDHTEDVRRNKASMKRRVIRISYDRPSDSRIVFSSEAFDELTEIFGWGKETPRNTTEQVVCLYGRKEDSLFVIDHVRECRFEIAGAKNAVFSQITLDSALDELDKLRTIDPDTMMLGFAHSHPCELETTLSEADVSLHRELTDKTGLELTVLINPQKRQIKAYSGTELELAEIFLAAPLSCSGG